MTKRPRLWTWRAKKAQFRLCTRMKMDLGLLEQENLVGGRALKQVDQNGEGLAHPVPNVDQVESRTTAPDSDLEWIAFLLPLLDDLDLLKETRVRAELRQGRPQRGPSCVRRGARQAG